MHNAVSKSLDIRAFRGIKKRYHRRIHCINLWYLIWPARRDSNPRPSESESAAISSFATGGCADIIAQKKAGSKSGGRAAQKYFFDGQQNWKKLLQKSEVSLIIYELLIFSATVAQLVEQLIRNQQVAGSSPASSSTKETSFVYQDKRGFLIMAFIR